MDMLPSLAMNDSVKPKDMKNLIKNIILVDITTKLIPVIFKGIENFIKRETKKKITLAMDKKDVKKASIQFHRIYEVDKKPNETKSDNDNDTFDAIVWRICQLPQTRYLKLAANGVYVITNHDVIKIDDDYNIKQISVTFSENNEVLNACIELFSYTVDLLKMKEYISDIHHRYMLYRNNQLGQKLYYFDELTNNVPLTIEGTVNYDLSPKNMSFTMSALYTNKSMTNVYGKSMNTVRKRVKFFEENKKWYEDKGIPYTLGLLLHGEPGCGKTSLIKAISKDTNRHVFNIKLNEFSTVSQINSIFFNERVTVIKDGQSHIYNIPLDKRIIVIEDIDCLSKIVLERNKQTNQPDLENDDTNINLNTNMTGKDKDKAIDKSILNHSEAFNDRFQAGSVFGMIDTPSPWNRHATFDNNDINARNHVKSIENEKPNIPIVHSQQLTLSYLLNVFDGILETPGRIVIMTSNYPDKLDAALIRPGRVDLKVHFGKCNLNDITEMIEKIADKKCTMHMLRDIPSDYWTPAEVTQKIFENIDDIVKIIEALNVYEIVV